MPAKRKCTGMERQRGAMFLLLVGVIVLIGAALFLGVQNLNSFSLARQDTVARDLQKAKQALIAYAVNYSDNFDDGGAGFGNFPCPDYDFNDSPDGICEQSVPGRIPIRWESDDTGKVRELYPYALDASTRFWYFVSPQFRPNGSTAVNPDTAGELTVDGIGGIVAIVIDPGPPFRGQDRPSVDVTDYLESDNQDGDNNFVTSFDGEFNDRLIYITRDEIMPMVEKRVLYSVFKQLERMEKITDFRWLPDAANLGDPDANCVPTRINGFLSANLKEDSNPAGCDRGSDEDEERAFDSWVVENEWYRYIYYHVDPNCRRGTNCNRNSNNLEVTINGVTYEKQSFLVALFGKPLTLESGYEQNRNDPSVPHSPRDYLDSAISGDDSGDNDDVYEFLPLDENNNDIAYTCQLRQQPPRPCSS